MDELKDKAWRNDAAAKVTGRTRYTDDLKLPGMLHAVPVYGDFVHAKLIAVDTKAAAKSKGVVRVLTARDIPGNNRAGQILKDLHVLADDKIRYHGDVVAIVVAETRAQALAAARLVKVQAEPLPEVLDPEAALTPGAPLVHEEHGTNLIHRHVIRRGDIDAGLAESAFVIEQEFRTPFIEHGYLEPEAALCRVRDDGVVEVRGSMQHPYSTRRFVADLLGLPLARIEVVGTPMGGGFGGKDDTAALICARTALAAQLTGRPVKMTYDREWSMRESYKRHPYLMRYRMGVGADGLIRAVHCRMIADGGAYCSVSPWVTWRSTVQCCGPYVVPNVDGEVSSVYTNHVFTGAMRGFGSPQVNFAVEQLAEMAAEKAGLSGVEFRRRNMVRQGSPTITGQVLDGHAVSLSEVFDRVLAASGYEDKLKRSSRGCGEDDYYGIGLAISYRGVSLGAEGTDFCAAVVSVQFDGSVLLETGIHENGQGAESAMILLLAEELGLDRSRIVYRPSSTSSVPDSGTTVASRATIMGGGAVSRAAATVRLQMAGAVADELGCSPETVRFIGGRLIAPDGRDVDFVEAARRRYRDQKYPYALGVFPAPRVDWDESCGQGKAYFTWVYGCQAVELTVGRRTGRIRLLNAWAAHDVGRAVNRAALLGQFYGGMAMGAGYGLFETVAMDGGRLRSLNFDTYHIPRSIDLPEMTAIIVENRDPLSPSGAKSIGEPANELMAPAIANAYYHATGRRRFELPIGGEK
ncbi:MAG: xanthine dehydrogenase family protein molybdopterin-binding subunit [Candidatus Aminicenantes bacterium]|nr:xanthine dehydrogenase family protein molybdopterin-binding subunit [Candidatus Aminicenantes bacterium]